jgi:hypothetical protein
MMHHPPEASAGLKLGPGKTFAGLVMALVAAAAFWVIAALPYLQPSGETLNAYPGTLTLDRRLGMLGHVVGGTIALFTGPLLIWLGETRQWLHLHRRLGFVYLVGAAITCVSAFYLSFTTPIGFLFASGLFGMALACTTSTGLAFLAIQRRNIPQHREWMIRSCVTVFAFVFFRFIFAVLEATGVGAPQAATAGTSTQAAGIAALAADVKTLRASFAAWSSWSIPLLVTEVLLQWPKLARRPGTRDGAS